MNTMKTIIFTDLDGTLLNHDDYSFDDAKKALEKIKKKNIPLIFTTSKTKVEVELLQKKLDICEPFIIENGAAIFFPKEYKDFDLSFLRDFEDYKILQLGKTYGQILNFYKEYKDEFEMLGFSDMSVEDVSKYTGLDESLAQYAKNRDFTEPFLLKDDSKLENLKNLALTDKIKITKGGRFYHLIGEKQDKGLAVKKAIELFAKLFDKKIKSIALGDGQNDIAMLKEVNIPIAIQAHDGTYIDEDIKNLEKSSFMGPKGWNEMVLKHV